MDIQNWFIPTICFVIFAYLMAFLFMYTLKDANGIDNQDKNPTQINKAHFETMAFNGFIAR